MSCIFVVGALGEELWGFVHSILFFGGGGELVKQRRVWPKSVRALVQLHWVLCTDTKAECKYNILVSKGSRLCD
jgi:hypothetical protein